MDGVVEVITGRERRRRWSNEDKLRIDAIFDAERTINGQPPEQRLAVRQKHVAPLVTGFETWMRQVRAKMSRHADVARAMDYMLRRWDTFARFLDDGRIDLTNDAAERALRGVASTGSFCPYRA